MRLPGCAAPLYVKVSLRSRLRYPGKNEIEREEMKGKQKRNGRRALRERR